MAIQTVFVGTTPGDDTGDPARTAFIKINDNFTQPENAASHLLLGTVSQSGGVPTGAIIQRGSNANGEFVGYADGTQICFRNYTLSGVNFVALGNSFVANAGIIAFPVSFSTVPSTSVNASRSGGTGYIWSGNPASTTTVYQGRLYSTAASSAESIKIEMISIGRWY